MDRVDLNLKIIDAVKLKPCLYQQHGTREERERGWKELSEQLKMKEQYLKIRWYFLVNAYRTDDSFKYANQMQFVEPKVELKVKSGAWPEFEITEDDIAVRRTNIEEYVFLEVDDLENNTQDNPPASSEELKCEDSDGEKKCDDITILYNTKEERISPTENNNSTVHSTPTDESNKSTSEIKNTATDRCEDVIFGELVTAMLKRMEEDKKRYVKKEIMNILLT